MSDKSEWSPDRTAAIKELIRNTITSVGGVSDDQLPHRVRALLHDQLDGVVNIDEFIGEILAEERRKGS